ncbi:MAG TPA: PLP-dependent aspartate aminotransferase family protein [Bryobacteraceae bacterium]|nr:PLP-dependent aspartate aminotransferase family protein [Bryobacteraceae bacterium]
MAVPAHLASAPLHFKTRAIHAGYSWDPATRAVVPPIVQSSTFAFREVGVPGPYEYSRSSNPTREALEKSLASLENGAHGFAFATGMAAELTVLMLLEAGDSIIVHNDLYGGTWRLLTNVLAHKGITAQFVDLRDTCAVCAAITASTKAIWIETPTNPLMNLVDLAAISAIAREHGLITMCDNTFLSPWFQRPLDLGIDIVVHSTTKYINGHSDVVGGAAITSSAELGARIGYLQNAMGTCAAPMDCFLVLRGIRTLAVRMEEHNRNALALARWLEGHPKVAAVLHPGLSSHPQHALAQRQMTGYGGTFSFRIRGGRGAANQFLEGLELFTLAESLGGVESLIEHPRSMTHSSVPTMELDRMGITDDVIRVSVGIEDIDDLKADLAQAFTRVFENFLFLNLDGSAIAL